MLVHICCSVDSHYFLQKLRERYPKERLTGFFYDPNIHPYSEYRLRLLEVRRSCEMLGIDLIEGEYDTKRWLEAVRGYENEPEKGARCDLCFDNRLETTAKKARELGEERITTTLLTSPKKSIEQLLFAGEKIAEKYGVRFVAPDFRKEGGTQEQFALARKDRLYRQDYCGCLYALKQQRKQQNRPADELFSPLGGQIQPESIEERIELYRKRIELEAEGKAYEIVREKFLNYRLLGGWLKQNGRILPSYFLAYSTMKRKFTKAKIFTKIEDIYYLNREEIRLVPLTKFNQIINASYTNIKDLLFNPPTFEKELKARNEIVDTFFSLSAIIVIEDIDPNAKFQVFCDAQIYEDVREHLVILG